MERRHARRFELRVPVICKCEQDGTRKEIAGFSRDISVSGVSVVTCTAGPVEGTDVDIEVLLPPFDAKSQALELKSHGHVVWRGSAEDGFGFGVAGSFGTSEDHVGRVSTAVARDNRVAG